MADPRKEENSFMQPNSRQRCTRHGKGRWMGGANPSKDLEYCRYGVKHKSINQSINQKHRRNVQILQPFTVYDNVSMQTQLFLERVV